MIDTKKRLFKKEYAQELLRIAEGDFLSAQALMKQKEGRLENIVFLAQQAIEKALKAALVHLQISFPMVHDLGILVALFPEDKTPPHGFNLAELNSFASVRRYEEGQLQLSVEEIKVVLESSQTVITWAANLVRS